MQTCLGRNALQIPFFLLSYINNSEQQIFLKFVFEQQIFLKQVRRLGTSYQPKWPPPSLRPFRNRGAYPKVARRESAEHGEKEGFQSSLFLLPFTLGLQNVHLSVKNGGTGTAKGVCKDHREGLD